MSEISTEIEKCFTTFVNDKKLKDTNERRVEFEKFKKIGIPNNKSENWKYSSLVNDINKFSDLKISKKKQKIDLKKNLLNFNHDKIFIVDGVLYDAEINQESIMLSEFKNLKKIQNNNSLTYLNNAFACDGFELEVTESTKAKKPIIIYNYFTENLSSFSFINIKNNIIINENSELILYFNNIFLSDKKYFFNNVTNIELKKKAVLKKYLSHDHNKNSSLYNFYNINVGDFAKFEYFNYIQNTFSCRDEIYANLNGDNSFASLINLENLNQNYNHESKWIINHNKPNTKSSQFLKSALHDKSSCVFQGKIFVESVAQKTDGYQLSRALLLSDLCKFTAKPELEIYADDVKCSHGSSSGSIDEESLFYLRSRGINEKDAKKMMIEGFLAESINKISDKTFQEIFLNKLALSNEY